MTEQKSKCCLPLVDLEVQKKTEIPFVNFSEKMATDLENSRYILQYPGCCQTYQNLNRKFVRVCQTQLQREGHLLQEAN